jgi:hypothetical protein
MTTAAVAEPVYRTQPVATPPAGDAELPDRSTYPSMLEGKSAETLASAACMEDVFDIADLAIALVLDGDTEIKNWVNRQGFGAKVTALEAQVAGLETKCAALAETEQKLETQIARLAGATETLTALEQTKREPGSRGPRGPRGEPGPRLERWLIDETAFAATPILSDNSVGPALLLRGLLTSIARQLAREVGR